MTDFDGSLAQFLSFLHFKDTSLNQIKTSQIFKKYPPVHDKEYSLDFSSLGFYLNIEFCFLVGYIVAPGRPSGGGPG